MDFRCSKYLQNGPRGKITGTRSRVSMRRVGVGMSGTDTSVSTLAHLLGGSPCLFLAQDLLFLPGVWNHCATTIHLALGSRAHLFPVIAWSKWSAEFKCLPLSCCENVERNKQEDRGPGFSTLGGHLLPPVLDPLLYLSPASPPCSLQLWVAGGGGVTWGQRFSSPPWGASWWLALPGDGGRGFLLNPTPAIHKSGNFHKRPSGLSPPFSKI